MRSRLILLSLCALALAGCQSMGGIHHQATPAPGPAPGTRASASHGSPSPSPWAVARAHGMAFRAAGSTPAWSVEVQKSHSPTLFVVLRDSGRQMQVPHAKVSGDPKTGTVEFRGNAGDGTPVELTIHRGQCRKDMHGHKSAAAVELDVGASQYQGCGRFLLQ